MTNERLKRPALIKVMTRFASLFCCFDKMNLNVFKAYLELFLYNHIRLDKVTVVETFLLPLTRQRVNLLLRFSYLK